MVLKEPPVFGGDERLLHVIRNVAERHPDAPVAGLEHVGEILPLPSSTTLSAGQFLALQPRLIGQIGRRIVEELDHLAEIDHRLGRPFSFLQNW